MPLFVLAGVLAGATSVLAQAPAEADAPAPRLVDERTLESIRERLTQEPVVTDKIPRFQVEIVGRNWPTFAQYVRGTDFAITGIEPPTSGPRFGGSFVGGVDLLQLAAALRARIQERQAQQIRARITAELEALEAMNAAARSAK